ncbi:MAG: M28 family metallopeptidase [Omnitrophica WOR_2 bacterium]
MTDYTELMGFLSVPRPNGSAAERKTLHALQDWLTRHDIPFHTYIFRQYPYFFEAIGVWLIVSRTLLVLAFFLHLGWIALLIALLGLIGGTLDMLLHLPLVSWVGARQGENILIELEPFTGTVRREVILSAHYDSKTEPLDHHQRMCFLKNIPFGIVLTILLGLLSPLDRFFWQQNSPWNHYTLGLGIGLSLALLILAWGMGLNLSLGRLIPQSRGAADNGSACAILLGLAEKLHEDHSRNTTLRETGLLDHTRVTLALFTGEEVDRQGSRAYALHRQEQGNSIPVIAIHLEAMAQDGDYVYWEQDGSIFRLRPTDESVSRLLIEAVQEITGHSPLPGGPITSDGASFIQIDIPTGVLGTYDRRWVTSGFHRPSDNLDRVVMDRLPEGVEILYRIIQKYDQEETGAQVS